MRQCDMQPLLTLLMIIVICSYHFLGEVLSKLNPLLSLLKWIKPTLYFCNAITQVLSPVYNNDCILQQQDPSPWCVDVRSLLTMASRISVVIECVFIIFTQDVTGVFLNRIENENCRLIIRCSFEQVPARTLGECGLITITMCGIGSYYNSSTKFCNVCKVDGALTSISSQLGYYATGI